MTKDILVFVQVEEGSASKVSLETLSIAYDLAQELGSKVIALLVGKDLDQAKEEVLSSGADKALLVQREAYNPEEFANVISEVAKKLDPKAVFLGASLEGKDLAPFVAAELDTAAITDAEKIEIDGDGFKYQTPVYGGTVLSTEVLDPSKVQIATIRSGSFKKKEGLEAKTDSESLDIEPLSDLKTKVKDVVVEVSDEISLEDAEFVVTIGRGAEDDETFEEAKELAQLLGAAVAGTRPVIDDGKMPKTSQIGQSGKIVTPKLYVGLGVSGAVQHITGVTGSDFIFAVNKDEDAPIFNYADVGIVGDCKKILPLLIDEIKKLKA